MGIDVVSPGELHTAVRAGFPMENAFFHGNCKTDDDIRFAITHRIGWFVCDNADELDAIDAEAARQGIRQKILLRLAPGPVWAPITGPTLWMTTRLAPIFCTCSAM